MHIGFEGAPSEAGKDGAHVEGLYLASPLSPLVLWPSMVAPQPKPLSEASIFECRPPDNKTTCLARLKLKTLQLRMLELKHLQ